MKLFMSKKGNGDAYTVMSKWVYYLLAIVIISFAMIGFVGSGFNFVQSQVSTPLYLEEDILIAQLVNTCFVYEERTGDFAGTIHQNVIDIAKFTQTRLEGCTDENIQLSLRSIEDDFETVELDTGLRSSEYQTTRYVLVRTSSGVVPAQLWVRL